MRTDIFTLNVEPIRRDDAIICEKLTSLLKDDTLERELPTCYIFVNLKIARKKNKILVKFVLSNLLLINRQKWLNIK